ncbi:multidrug effflux MFS transporter [Enterovibrio coralii]|uniref:MFS transporter n=1 Tax=Enterovibrio coralii TaxID=294935 RepID=A0A135I5P6_9GAMM|nr:multidrug effflux MFS transporter [Enterovibrio coralii]KXF80770.1 MFS transporter [Enterovibrio coralii]
MPDKFPIRPVLLACLIVSIGQLSVGLLFPALPSIAQNFSLNAEQVQRLISYYLLGFGPSQLFYGPLSDAIGRKPVLLTGIAISIVGLALTVWGGDTFALLLWGRFLQGLGAGCCSVLSRASLRDSYSYQHLALAMTWLGIVASFSPIIAPVIGGFVNHHFGWLAVFVVMLSYIGLVWMILAVSFKETVNTKSHVPPMKTVLSDYKKLITSSYFISFSGIGWLNYSMVVVAISVIPFVMQVQIGMTSDQYAMWALIPAFGLLLGGTICNKLRPRFGSENMLKVAPCLHALAGIWLIVAPLTPAAIIAGQFLMVVANGIAFPCAQSQLLLPFKNKAGTTAALGGAMQMVTASLLSMFLMMLGMSKAWHLGLLLVCVGILGSGLVRAGFSEKNRLDDEGNFQQDRP